MPGQPLYPVINGSASPPPPLVQMPPPDDGNGGISTELIVVLSIAGLVLAGVLLIVIINCLKKWRCATQRPADSQPPPRTTSGHVIPEVDSGAVDSVHAQGTSATGGNQTEESLNTESLPRQHVPVENIPSESIPTREPPQPVFPSSGYRACAGCKNPIGHGRFLGCMDAVWHPQCFRCFACNKPISESEFGIHEDQPYHKSCYKDFFHPKCVVCKNFTPTDEDGLIEYQAHPFWMQAYCPSHEDDGTPRCCSCERMEPTDTKYITLDDGRKLCLECLTSATMDSPECQHLYIDIQEFFEGLNMKVEQQVLLLLVQRQALNEALEAEKSGLHLPETRGVCLSEEQIVETILRRPTIGPGNIIMDMITGPYKLVRRCEVTAILILYGLPRLQTGSILAHEMMHAYLRLKGYRSLSPQVEEGICQVLSHMWLESEIIAGASGNVVSTSAASSSSLSSTPTSSQKGAKTEFEKKLVAFIKNQIETDSSVEYGDGFRAGIRAVEQYGLRSTLDHMKITGSFP